MGHRRIDPETVDIFDQAADLLGRARPSEVDAKPPTGGKAGKPEGKPERKGGRKAMCGDGPAFEKRPPKVVVEPPPKAPLEEPKVEAPSFKNHRQAARNLQAGGPVFWTPKG